MASRLSRTGSFSPWAVVLAGGQGRRLRGFVEQTCGDARAKQFAPLLGGRTMLRNTLDRVALEFPPASTLVVTLQEQLPLVLAELRPGEATRVLAQPDDRGTAPAILYPAHWARWLDPEAVLCVFPSDHFVVDERAFMRCVARVAGFVERRPGLLVLLGATPSGPDSDYGWIVPGETLGEAGGLPVTGVRRFVEKPSEAEAKSCLAAGGLWNTFVFAAKATTLLALGRQHLSELSDTLASVAPFAGATDSWALRRAYEATPPTDFSRDWLQPGPPCLAVARLPGLVWSDLGTPARILAISSRPAPPGRGRPRERI